ARGSVLTAADNAVAGTADAGHDCADQAGRSRLARDWINGTALAAHERGLIQNNLLRRIVCRRIEVRELAVLLPDRRDDVHAHAVIERQLRGGFPRVLQIPLGVPVRSRGHDGFTELIVTLEISQQRVRIWPIGIAWIQSITIEQDGRIVWPERILLFDGILREEARLEGMSG